jgi:hypothetical protein
MAPARRVTGHTSAFLPAAARVEPSLLVFVLLACFFSAATAEMGSPGSYPPNVCERQGLAGTCNGCVCCCAAGPGEKPRLFPTDACACAPPVLDRAVDASTRLTALVVGGAGLVAISLLATCWFCGWCCASPYDTDE